MNREENPTRETMDIYHGVRWSAVAKYGAQAIELVTSLVVARLLMPEDYGLLGMAIVISGFLAMFQSLGIGAVVVQRRDVSDDLLSSLFYVNIVFGVVLATAMLCFAPAVSWIYGDSRVGTIVAVLSVVFLLDTPAIIPSSLMTRWMAFRRLAFIEITVAMCRALTALTMAVLGWGVWALVGATIVGPAVQTVLLFAKCPWRPRLVFRWNAVRGAWSFGIHVTGTSLATFFARDVDKIIVGKFLGATSLGYYSLAYRLLDFPRQAIFGVASRVLFPALSRMQNDDARLRAACLRIWGAMAFIACPLLLGAVAVADPFVRVVLGEKWLPSVPLIYVLAPLGMLEAIAGIAGLLFLVKGRADWMFRWSLVVGLLCGLSFLAGVPYGVFGVAVAYAVTRGTLTLLGNSIVFRLIKNLTQRDFLRVALPYVAYAGAMALIVRGGRVLLDQTTLDARVSLVLSIGLGVVSYCAIVLVMRAQALADVLRFLPGRWAAAVRSLLGGWLSLS